MGTREDKAMRDILKGEVPKRQKFYAVGGKSREEINKLQQEKSQKQSKKNSERAAIWNELFECEICGKNTRLGGSKLDKKMHAKTGRCFNCLIEEENKMRINGTYKEYERKKVLNNKLSMLKEQKEKIHEFKNTSAPSFYNETQKGKVYEEKWKMNVALYKKVAEEALVDLDKIIEETEKELNK